MKIAVSSQMWAWIWDGPFAVHFSPDGQSAASHRLWGTDGGKGFSHVWGLHNRLLGLFMYINTYLGFCAVLAIVKIAQSSSTY